MKKQLNFLLNKLLFFFSKELNSGRIFGLDLLRAYAIVIVMIGHGKFMLPEKIKNLHKYIYFDGVSIFFVLSGFLIGGILIKQLEAHPHGFHMLFNFWIRRWTRTLPAYFLVLIILTICYYLTDPLFSFEKIQKYYFFSQTLFREPDLVYFRESWSLSVEEWFYLLIPLFIFILIIFFKISIRLSLVIVVVLVLLSVTIMRYQLYITKDSLSFHHKVFFRLDSIMYGVLGSYVHFYYNKYWKSNTVIFFVSGIILFITQKYIELSGLFLGGFYNTVLEYSITALGTLLLLPFLSEIKETKNRAGKLITIISLISYSMYLTHMALIKDLIIYKIPWKDYTTNYNIILSADYFLYWFMTLTVSIFIYKYFEIPTTRLRDKLKFNRVNSEIAEARKNESYSKVL